MFLKGLFILNSKAQSRKAETVTFMLIMQLWELNLREDPIIPPNHLDKPN